MTRSPRSWARAQPSRKSWRGRRDSCRTGARAPCLSARRGPGRSCSRGRGGPFGEDLVFRLSTVVLKLPPLRERGDDLMIVARALLARLAHEYGLPVPALTSDVIRQLRSHPWPGNIRELKNALERALLLSPRGELSADEFLPAGDAGSTQDGPIPFPAPLHQITAAAVRATVRMSGGNRSEAARRLSISPRRLRRLLSGALDVGEDADEGWWVEAPARSM